MCSLRKGYLREHMAPHNLPMTILGAALLWFGWFGFNAGSALASNGLASLAFVTTNTAAASAAISWSLAERFHRGKPTALGAVSGAVAGLVAITPAAGFVSPLAAIAIGFAAGMLCYGAVSLKPKAGYDDSLDVLGIHGVGGLWGALATGIFATVAVNPDGANGLLAGNPSLLKAQVIASVATIAYSGVVSLIILKAIDLAVGLRVGDEHEVQGLDLSQHGENGYDMI
jgi:Amt family ammonium transporter